MKKLGLVGGMGPESTIPYYHGIVYGVQNAIGEKVFPNLIIDSVDVFKVLQYSNQKKYDALADYLMLSINSLIAGGADFIAMSANTPHVIFNELQKQSSVPLISIVETARDDAVSNGYKKIGLIGTIPTMNGSFFITPFTKHGINIVLPSEDEKIYIDTKISEELELGIVKKDTLENFLSIIQRMKDEDGIQAIVLGCTELPLILNDDVSSVPCLDTMQIHIRALVNEIIRAN